MQWQNNLTPYLEQSQRGADTQQRQRFYVFY
jgi:hypothetical protein